MKTKQLFRVLPWIETASEDEPGHPLYVHTPQGSGRVDNPEHYTVLYASDDPVGAIGEAFGNLAIWTPGLLEGPPLLSSSRRALVTYAAGDAETLDLDDPESLVDRQLKPSGVVTRDRRSTQRWALKIYSEHKWAGVRWWSYYCPDWGSFGMWERVHLEIADIRPLDSEMPLVLEAASILNRIWET